MAPREALATIPYDCKQTRASARLLRSGADRLYALLAIDADGRDVLRPAEGVKAWTPQALGVAEEPGASCAASAGGAPRRLCRRRHGTRRGIATATTSAAFIPHLERCRRAAAVLSVADIMYVRSERHVVAVGQTQAVEEYWRIPQQSREA